MEGRMLQLVGGGSDPAHVLDGAPALVRCIIWLHRCLDTRYRSWILACVIGSAWSDLQPGILLYRVCEAADLDGKRWSRHPSASGNLLLSVLLGQR